MSIAVIGCGSIGLTRTGILATRLGQSVRFYDAAQGNGCEERALRVRTLESLLAAQPRAVFLCTPAATHIELAHTVVAHGLDLFIEKPLSLTMDGVASLLDAVRERDLIAMGACNLRFAYGRPSGYAALDLVSKKPLRDWRSGASDAYAGSGILFESAVHEVDLAVSVLGHIREAKPGGDPGRGWCVLDLSHAHGRSRISCDWRDTAPTLRGCWATDAGGETHLLSPDLSASMYEAEMRHFLHCVETRESPCNPLADAAHVIEWLCRLAGSVASPPRAVVD